MNKSKRKEDLVGLSLPNAPTNTNCLLIFFHHPSAQQMTIIGLGSMLFVAASNIKNSIKLRFNPSRRTLVSSLRKKHTLRFYQE